MRPLRIAHLGTGSFRIMLLLYCARIEAQHRQHDDIVLVTPQPSPEKESLRPQFQTNEWGEPIYIHNPMSIGHSEIYVKKALQDRPPIPVATSLKEVCSLSKTIRFPPEPKARSPGIYPWDRAFFICFFIVYRFV